MSEGQGGTVRRFLEKRQATGPGTTHLPCPACDWPLDLVSFQDEAHWWVTQHECARCRYARVITRTSPSSRTWSDDSPPTARGVMVFYLADATEYEPQPTLRYVTVEEWAAAERGEVIVIRDGDTERRFRREDAGASVLHEERAPA